MPFWFASSEPKPNRLLLFSTAPPMPVAALPPYASEPTGDQVPLGYVRDAETSERGLVFGPGGLEDVFAFSLHVEAAQRYFRERGVTASHDFTAR